MLSNSLETKPQHPMNAPMPRKQSLPASVKTPATRRVLNVLCAGAGAAAALACTSASAVLVVEDFQYAQGEITGGNGGAGFGGAWASVNTANTQVVGGLSYTDGVTGLTLGGVGNALQIGNTAGNSLSGLFRPLAATVNQSSLFVSLLVRQSAGTFSPTDWAYMYFGTGSGSSNSERMGMISGNASGDYGVQLSNGSSVLSAYAGGPASGNTYLLVSKLEKVGQTGASDPYDKISFWVNPSLYASTFGTPQAVVDFSGANQGISSLSRLGFGTFFLEVGDNATFDRLRMGDTVGDILPLAPEGLPVIPEGQTVGACAGLVALGGAWYARRRRTSAS
jgi:hypothetical protein